MLGHLVSVGRTTIMWAGIAVALVCATAMTPSTAAGESGTTAAGVAGTPAVKTEGPVPWTWLAHGTIDFATKSSGWFCGYNPEAGCWTVFRSADGGSSWKRQRHIVDMGYNEYGPSQMRLYALSDRCCFAVDGRRVFRTTDGGRHWRRMYTTGARSTTILSTSFVSPSVGYMSVSTLSRNLVRRTTSGGRSWVTLVTPSVSYGSLSFVDLRHGWASRGDRVLRTTNAGRTWQRCGRTKVESVFGVSFVSRSIGWAAGLWGIEKTADGGRTWQHQLREWRNGGSVVLAQSPAVVWTCGIGGERSYLAPWAGAEARGATGVGGMPSFGTFRRSTDGGASWATIGVAEAYWFDAVGARCWMVCRPWNGDSYLIRSDDRGTTWTRL